MNLKKYIAALLITLITCFSIFGGASLARFLYGDSLSDEIEELLDKPVDKKINILVMGLDEDKIRADTIMIANINPENKSIKLMSIPRDTKVHVGSSSIKINATMSYKSKEELMIQKLREVTGMPIHYYAEVDFYGFIKIVDILGGVDYNVPYPMNYDDPEQNLHIHLNAGMQHLNGKQAHDFVRFRQNNDGTAPSLYALGDEGRIKAQQAFIKELVRQKLQPQYLAKAPELIEQVYKYVKTNFTIADALRYVGVLSKIEEGGFETFTLPGAGEYQGGVSYYIHNVQKTRELVYQEFGYLNGESVPLPPEPTPTA